MELQIGVEPMTARLQGECSTTELLKHIVLPAISSGEIVWAIP